MQKTSSIPFVIFIAIVGGSAFIALVALATLIEALLSDQYVSTDYYLSATLIFTGHLLTAVFAVIARLNAVKRGHAEKARSVTETQIESILKNEQLSEDLANWYADGMQSMIDEMHTFYQLSTQARRMQVDSLIRSLANIADYYEKNEPKNTEPDIPPVFKKE